MSELSTEEEIFAAATAPGGDDDAPLAPTASQPEVETPAEPSSEEQPQDQSAQPQVIGEPRQAGGDLTVALREERERVKALRADLEREREERSQFMRMLQQSRQPAHQDQAQQPADPVALWDDPDKWAGQLVDPVRQEVQRTREFYSQRLAVQQHGADKVKEAYSALDAAINRGDLSKDAVLASLQQSMDPYGEIMGWFENQPANAEQRMREKIMEELRASGQLPQQRDEAGRFQAAGAQPSAAQAPGNSNIPSLNRAIGTAGAPQSGSISDDDIFNSAPAFGRSRKA